MDATVRVRSDELAKLSKPTRTAEAMELQVEDHVPISLQIRGGALPL
jgi:hypothetical protein